VALPKSIRFPTVGVTTEIEQVGATGDGGMDVPVDPARAGWYRYGPRPGDQGNAAIAGHVDWGGKVMPFWNLNRLKAGDPVEILAADGRTFEFKVKWSRWYDAEDAPIQEIFGSSGASEVTLVTCGGNFNSKTREYSHRLVVRASQAATENN
jgi:LPXTG-site transpeptidase (sortase) family protein